MSFSPSDSAMHRVMQTPELLELVLLRVDMATSLTAAQRVSRFWSRTIRESLAIQTALFFLPSARNDNDNNKSSCVNPLLAHYFPGWFAASGTPVPSMQDFAAQPFAAPGKFAAFMFPDASWRGMLIQQGIRVAAAASDDPARDGGALGVWRTTRSRADGSFYAASMLYLPADGERGLTMGRYYDLAVSFVMDESRPVVYWPEDCDAFLAMEDLPRVESNGESAGGNGPLENQDLRIQKSFLAAQASVIWLLANNGGAQKARDYDAVQQFSERFMHDKHQGKGPSSSTRHLWSGSKQNAFPVEQLDWSMMRD
ncbi:hypothetical protein Micbo1qcDRAFT_205281 [Microdochium bolleyi]|uniref:F-box domain-containing protein n=1 Tax=Microdochium bolleyi TaxID=196109 RepID=A0A136J039_9PEZI|nr:hypothetical protein Micbo1qcDRAFT_205281 [Microdochium bolleyi]